MSAAHGESRLCPSTFQLDRADAGELLGNERLALERHVGTCARCQERRAALAREQAWFSAHAPALPAPPPRLTVVRSPVAAPRAPVRRWVWSGGLAAAAALVVVVLGFGDRTRDVRTKGGARLAFFVRHDGVVRTGAPGEVVAPGDALEFAFAGAAGAHVAVLSRDPDGRASVYYPLDGRTARVPDGDEEMTSSNSVVLDATLGQETLYGLVCRESLALEPVRRAVERGDPGAWPASCAAHTLVIEKRRP